jgi:hypothetical protein
MRLEIANDIVSEGYNTHGFRDSSKRGSIRFKELRVACKEHSQWLSYIEHEQLFERPAFFSVPLRSAFTFSIDKILH